MLLKMEIQPPEILKKSLMVPNKTLMGPGPSNYSQRVLDAIGNPVLGHMHPECFQIMDDIKEGIKYLFQTKNPVTLCISASGHGALEASLFNVIEDGDVILIGVTGIWGKRAADIASRLGADIRLCEAKLGYALTIDEIQNAFDIHKPKIFFLAHGDSSTGVIQVNMKEIGEICKRNNCIFIVDCVASLGGVEFYMDDWKIDIAYTASQKVLGAPPGLCPISFSSKAMHKINTRLTKIKSYYWDINLLGQYWNCFGGSSRIYHHTISTTLLYGLREALSHVCGQGLISIIRKHMDCSIRLQKGIENMGLEMFVTEPSYRLPTINAIKIPRGVDWRKVSEYAARKYFLEISGGLGPTAEMVIRIGLLGENATVQKVDLTLFILREAIQNTSNIMLSEKSKI